MLVLSRKKFESIVIGDGIVVTVIEMRGDKVRLGIVAPRTMPVHRQEVFDVIRSVAGAERPPAAPAPVEGPDVLPDLIVECRLATGAGDGVRFDGEGGFRFGVW
jgi:carbon storage regulator